MSGFGLADQMKVMREAESQPTGEERRTIRDLLLLIPATALAGIGLVLVCGMELKAKVQTLKKKEIISDISDLVCLVRDHFLSLFNPFKY